MALALITGASSGIGLELAKQFAQHGFDLVIAAEDDGIHSATNRFLPDSVKAAANRVLAVPLEPTVMMQEVIR